jgi:NAD(P)-dependent dehydrogenase (short-subunit alcohol dehydrogenase family)
MHDNIQGKHAAIVGGTHGMGLATAQLLQAHGARVLATGSNPASVAAAQAALGPQAQVLRSDIASAADRAALVGHIADQLGHIDALYVFAAVAEFAPMAAVSEAAFDRHFAINTKGCYFLVQQLLPLLRRGGSITLTSVTPGPAAPGMSLYMATKGAVTAFARVLAAELLPQGIRVNVLAPGFINTPTLGLAGLTAAERAHVSALGDAITPMQRHGSPEEVAATARYLGFDATFTTGLELAVDGGLSTVAVPA